MKVFCICFVLWIVPFCLSAVDNFRLPGIRSMGMGGNGVTQSVLFNPALTAFHENRILSIDYFNRYGLKELGTVSAGLVYPNDWLPFAVDIASFGYDAYRQTQFRLAAGKRLNERWWLGVSVQYSLLQTELCEEVPMRLSADVGFLFSPVDKLLMGVLIMDFPSFCIEKSMIDTKEFSMYAVQIGFQWQIINSLLIVGTLETNKADVLGGNVGMEYMPFEGFRLRAGIRTTPLLPALGMGYSFSKFTLDVVASYHPILGISSGCGLSYSF